MKHKLTVDDMDFSNILDYTCDNGDCGYCDYCHEVMNDMDWACMNGCCACCGCTCWDGDWE